MTPKQYLQSVMTRYRSVSTYHDRGIARMTFRHDGTQEQVEAPMRVWWDHDQLQIVAYDATLYATAHELTAWIDDPATDRFDSQVLRRPGLAVRPTLPSLLVDPILADRLSGGLAGPPPQLEWLFADEPMQALFHGTYIFGFGENRLVDGHECRCVTVTDQNEKFFFWIDRQEGVIRRVELPAIALPASSLAGPGTVELSFLLKDAGFGSANASEPLATPPSQPKYVRQFVVPPIPPPHQVGKRPKPFQRYNRTGNILLSEKGSDREVTLIAIAGTNQVPIDDMDAWYRQLPAPVRNRLRVGIVTSDDRSIAPEITQQDEFAVWVDSDSAIGHALDVPPQHVVILDSQGTIAWVQPWIEDPLLAGDPSAGNMSAGGSWNTINAVLQDVMAGIDVPARLNSQWEQQRATYQQLLNQHAYRPNSP